MGDKIDNLREELRTLLQAAICEAYPAVVQFRKDAPALSDVQIHLSSSSEEFLAHAQQNYGNLGFLEKMLNEMVANSALKEKISSVQEKLVECGGRTWIGLGIYNPEEAIISNDERFLRSLHISPM